MFIRVLLDILFPPLCHVCKSFIPEAGELHLCTDCRQKIVPVSSPQCIVCGNPFNTEGGIDHLCGPCSITPKPFVSARAAVSFLGPVKELIHRLKYGKKTHLARPLAILTAERLDPFVSEAGIELIVPVPLHLRRLRARGFNQALLIAQYLSKKFSITLSSNNLRRIRWTEPQVNLSVDERIKNVREAFSVKDPEQFEGKIILLVDDVYTTGSTVAECAKVLKFCGASGVYVATVARAVFN
jgi:ComF family protein